MGCSGSKATSTDDVTLTKKDDTKSSAVLGALDILFGALAAASSAGIGNAEALHLARINSLGVAFRSIDKDGNGSLSFEEIKSAFEKAGEPVTDDHLRELLKEVDKDQNGTIDFGATRFFFSCFIAAPCDPLPLAANGRVAPSPVWQRNSARSLPQACRRWRP